MNNPNFKLLGFILNYGNTKTAAERAKETPFVDAYLSGADFALTDSADTLSKCAAAEAGRQLALGFFPKFFLKH